MSKVSITRSLLDNLANTISQKSGVAVPMTIAEMNTAVANIPSGGSAPNVYQDADGYVVLDDEAGTAITAEPLSVTTNGTYTAPTGKAYTPVTVNVSGGGSTSVAESDVNFYDYDGTRLHSYTVAEANALTELPANPSHTGLTAQGWNWTLAEIKSYLTDYPTGVVNVGQMYITESGATEIDIVFDDSNYLSPYLGVCPKGTVTVDWGDNSATDTLTGTSTTSIKYVQHVYSAVGSYTIKLTTTDQIGFYTGTSAYSSLFCSSTDGNRNYNRAYLSVIKAIRLGTGVVVGNAAFNKLQNCETITMPLGTTRIESYVFDGCFKLALITIPSGVTLIDTYAFRSCHSLTSIAIPPSVTEIHGNFVDGCYSLTSITIPSGVTEFYNSTFRDCARLTSITIPSGVTSIGNYAFAYCYLLTSITIPSGVTSINASVFSSNYNLRSITIPSGVTSIGNSAFQSCQSLISITIPSGVTSIGNSAFYSCQSLISITIPSSVTSIGNSAFYSCYAVEEYHFQSATPPTLGTSAFNNIVSGTKIYVPQGSLSDYQSATNWSTYADYIVEESA